MPKFRVETPNGTYEVEAPEGTTEEQIKAEIAKTQGVDKARQGQAISPKKSPQDITNEQSYNESVKQDRFNNRELGIEMGVETAKHALPSLYNVGKSFYDFGKETLTNPSGVVQTIGDLATGGIMNMSDTAKNAYIAKQQKDSQRLTVAMEKLKAKGTPEAMAHYEKLAQLKQKTDSNYERLDKMADETGQYYKDRYGGWKEIKQTVATDPAGFALDFTGASGVARNLAKTAVKNTYKGTQKVADKLLNKNPLLNQPLPNNKAVPQRLQSKTLENVGNAVDSKIAGIENSLNPLSLLGTGVNYAGSGLINSIDLMTGRVGATAVKGALKAGVESIPTMGGRLNPFNYTKTGKAMKDRVQGFNDARKGKIDDVAITNLAKNKLTQAQILKNKAYKKEMDSIKNDSVDGAFENIRKSLDDAKKQFSETNGATTDPAMAKMLAEMEKRIARFEADPRLQNVAGVDALKRNLQTIVDSIDIGNKSMRTAGQSVVRSVQQSLVQSNPKYAQIMKKYADESEFIDVDVGKTLGVTSRANIETMFNKLMKTTQETQKSKGRAIQSLDEFGETGQLLPQIIGSIFNRAQPRGGIGLAGVLSAGAITGGALTGSLAYVVPFLLAQSPKMMGAILYKMGQAGSVPTGFIKFLYSQPQFRDLATMYMQQQKGKEIQKEVYGE